MIHYEPHEVVQTVTGGSARLQSRHGLQMHCITPLQVGGSLRLEWRAQVAFSGGSGGPGSGFQWGITRRNEAGVESVVVMGDQTAARTTRQAACNVGGGGGRTTYHFNVRSSDWRENEALSLWMKPIAGRNASGSAASTCKLRVAGLMVSVEESTDRGLMYAALRGSGGGDDSEGVLVVPLHPPGSGGSAEGGNAEPARAVGMRRVRGVFLSAGGTIRVSWRLKVVDTLAGNGGGGGQAVGFRWLLSRRFCMSEEVAVAEGTDADCHVEALGGTGGAATTDNLLPFEAVLEGCSAEDTLCLWVGPRRGERWVGGVGAQTAHLATFELRLEKPNTSVWTPRPVLNFASTRPFEPAHGAQWVL